MSKTKRKFSKIFKPAFCSYCGEKKIRTYAGEEVAFSKKTGKANKMIISIWEHCIDWKDYHYFECDHNITKKQKEIPKKEIARFLRIMYGRDE